MDHRCIQVGFVGWRGMVGSVLLTRMREEYDFSDIFPVFFSTSQTGQPAPESITSEHGSVSLQNAYDLKKLANMSIIVSCQGSAYTQSIHPALRAAGWSGYWVDSASYLRYDASSLIVLDPINQKRIDQALHDGIKNYIGGNCTVSLLLLALHGLIQKQWVEWIQTVTYQAATGAGARCVNHLLQDFKTLSHASDLNSAQTILDRWHTQPDHQEAVTPLCANIMPWIDEASDHGQTREEWKGMVEARQILGPQYATLKIDSLCVRVPVIRCHAQALTVKLNCDVDRENVIQAIASANPWVKVIPNNQQDTQKYLHPLSVSGTLNIAIGRIRPSLLEKRYWHLFTVGDQLLWGAAEPLRRVVQYIIAFYRDHPDKA